MRHLRARTRTADIELLIVTPHPEGIVHAFGEMIGYWFGPDQAIKSYAQLELYRELQIRPDERQLGLE